MTISAEQLQTARAKPVAWERCTDPSDLVAVVVRLDGHPIRAWYNARLVCGPELIALALWAQHAARRGRIFDAVCAGDLPWLLALVD